MDNQIDQQEELTSTEESSEESVDVEKILAENGNLKRQLTKLKKSAEPEAINNQLLDRIQTLELSAYGYTQETVKKALELGGTKFLEDPDNKAMLDAFNENIKAKKASFISEKSNGKTAVHTKTQEDIDKMTSSQYEEYLSSKR